MAEEKLLVCLAKNNIDTSNFGKPEPGNEKSFSEWFWEDVLGFDSEAYRREFWREVHTTGHTIGHIPKGLDGFLRKYSACRREQTSILFMIMVLEGCSFAFWIIRRELSLLERRWKRSGYYEHERERRRQLAAERRSVTVRRTPNPMPTVAELREAFALAAQSPEGSLRFGGMLQDLEGYVDNHYVFDPVTGAPRGRCGGIKRFLEREAPELFARYSTVMSHKARAKKFRQACDARDPVPIDALMPISHGGHSSSGAGAIPACGESAIPPNGEKSAPATANQLGSETAVTTNSGGSVSTDGEISAMGHVFRGMMFPEHAHLRDVDALSAWMGSNGNLEYLKTRDWLSNPVGVYDETSLLRDDSQDLAAEMLAFCDGTLISLDAAIALKIDPRFIPKDAEPDPRVKTAVATSSVKSTAPKRIQDWLTRRSA